MKEDNSDNTRPDRENSLPGKTPQPFDPMNESRSDLPNERRYLHPSKPPKRDVSGRRVDVDDNSFGFELW